MRAAGVSFDNDILDIAEVGRHELRRFSASLSGIFFAIIYVSHHDTQSRREIRLIPDRLGRNKHQQLLTSVCDV